MATTGQHATPYLIDQFRKLAEQSELTALEWQTKGGPEPLPGWTDGVWAARKDYIWRNITVPAGVLVWLAFDQGSFRSFPRIRRFVGNWRTNIRAQHSGWSLSVVQGTCFEHLASFHHRKIMRDPRHPASEIEEALIQARVARELAKIIETEAAAEETSK